MLIWDLKENNCINLLDADRIGSVPQKSPKVHLMYQYTEKDTGLAKVGAKTIAMIGKASISEPVRDSFDLRTYRESEEYA
jgi:hypothetical protein